MPIDVTASRVLPFPPDVVADYAMDWRHDAEWTQGIRRAELTRSTVDGGFGVGAEVTRTAYFLRRRIDYVLRVDRYEPPTILEMRSVAGPFPMHVTYRFDAAPGGQTAASIRVRGGTGGFWLFGPLLAGRVGSSLRKDLRDLHRRLSERTGAGSRDT